MINYIYISKKEEILMYKFSKSIDINFNNDYEEVEFGVSLQSNTQFTFLECDYIFYRANCGHKEELFIVNYYSSSNNKEDAEEDLSEFLS